MERAEDCQRLLLLLLSKITEDCQILSKIRYGKGEDFQILSKIIEDCQILSKITEDCQMLFKIRYGKAEDSAIIQDWIWKADD